MRILVDHYFIIFFIFFLSCEGKQPKNIICNKNSAVDAILELPETKEHIKYIDSISDHKKGISIMIDSLKIKNQKYYEVKTGYDGELHWEVYSIFYVNSLDCREILINDVVSGNIIPISDWRNKQKQKKNMKSTAKSILFSDLFREGNNIKFTPVDLQNGDDEIKNFKNRLFLFENSNPSSDDFNVDDLSLLINNETFSNNETFIDSSWLDYFVKKYRFSSEKIYFLMNLAIEQEDLNAVNILKDYYVVSQLQINEAIKKANYVKSLNGKLDVDNYYDPTYSNISQIEVILRNRFFKNYIQDPDGFANLRKSNTQYSEVIQKIKSGEHIEVLDNSGDWFLVKTKEGKEGYVYKSRVKSE